ncbi:MAG: hypothetical protein ABJE95_18255 [Byssovorax sp.]
MAVPAVAAAQDQAWLKDRRYTEGIGYRVGDFELHPGASAEFGYDSNYFHRGPTDDGGPVGALRLRITPSFSLSTLSKQRTEGTANGTQPDFEFRASVAATYNEFFPVSGPQAGQDAMSRNRNIGGNLDLSLSILPGRPWSGTITAGVARSLTPSNEGLASQSFNRVLPHASAELAWTPGRGLFDWRLGYGFSGTFFESGSFSQLTNIQNQIETRGRWRFLPRTALLYDARLGFVSYTAPTPNGKTSSHPLRAQIGVNGLITSSFSALAMVGWGTSFYSAPPTGPEENFNSVIGQLELKWFITPNPSTDPGAATLSLSSLAVGFTRDFFDSYIGTYFERDRGYANLSYFFGGRFLVIVDGGVAAIVYPPNLQLHGLETGATDVRIDASVFGEYRFKDSFGLNATVRYGQNVSGTTITTLTPGVPAGAPDQLAWQQVEAYLGFRWFM